jgi:hypothetical protein
MLLMLSVMLLIYPTSGEGGAVNWNNIYFISTIDKLLHWKNRTSSIVWKKYGNLNF